MRETVEDVGPVDPPRSLWRSLGHLGPGIVLASSIVGSGELIATTAVGAQAGFQLLWLIVLGCAIKVAAQVEIGRSTLTWGRTPLAAFDRVPGPRFAGRGWIYWGWVVMMALILVQQGGILLGVAQSLAGGLPLTTRGRAWNQAHDEAAGLRVAEKAAERRGDPAGAEAAHERLVRIEEQITSLPRPADEPIWALVTGIVTAVLLAIGRYRLIERASMLLVGTFTLVTLLAVAMLQFDPAWAISPGEFLAGLVPSIPPRVGDRHPLATALGAFGIIGVGASELMVYPYWCLEKGYGRNVGRRDESSEWAARARGWLRVMQLDAWGSMVVYTLVTVAFYILGAATLGRLGILPQGGETVRTLGAMYAPVFGEWARGVFLVGAFAVLYSTLFVAAAGMARLITDGLILAGLLPGDDVSRAAWSRRLSVAWVLVAMLLALVIREPVAAVLASGMAQAVMLAALGVAVLHFRHRESDPRLAPSRAWDVLLWASCLGFIVIGLWTLADKLWTVWQSLGAPHG